VPERRQEAAVNNGSRHGARRAAVQAIYQWEMTADVPQRFEDHDELDQERGQIDVVLFDELVREIPRRVQQIDEALAPQMDRPIEEVDPVERAILRIGAYELLFHLQTPYKVILDEAVELAKVFGAEHGHRYVNAVLDKLSAEVRRDEARELN
jgi:N utilization substance protein B